MSIIAEGKHQVSRQGSHEKAEGSVQMPLNLPQVNSTPIEFYFHGGRNTTDPNQHE
jgi:hypothetical protein